MHKIIFSSKAEKDLKKLSHTDRKSLLKKVEKISIPFPKNFDIKSLTGVENFHRLRHGKMRVIFEIDKGKKEIWIRRVGYRASIYSVF